MPYNDLNQGGELEDFVIEVVPKGDPILPLMENYIDSIKGGDRAFHPNKGSKAVTPAWLRPDHSLIKWDRLSSEVSCESKMSYAKNL